MLFLMVATIIAKATENAINRTIERNMMAILYGSSFESAAEVTIEQEIVVDTTVNDNERTTVVKSKY